jgi:hypothetical protein
MKKIFTIAFVLITCLCHSQNMISNYAGDGIAGLLNGANDSTRFNEPFGICSDANGNIFIADGSNHCIRKIDQNGYSSVYAGSTVAGFADGPVASAQFNNPTNICIDNSGNLLVSDFQNHKIRKVSTSGIVSTVAGAGMPGFMDGINTIAQFNYPRGIATDASGNIYIADSWNHRIRKINGVTLEVTTYAGGGSNIGVGSIGNLIDGSDTTARFYAPSGLTIDNLDNLYVADPFNHRIRKIDSNQNVSSLAGTGITGPNNGGFADGNIATARFHTPTDLFCMVNGDLLVADTYNNRIRLINGSGLVSSIAGNGNAGFASGVDSIAEFNFPRGITSNSAGDSIFVVDYNNHTIRLVNSVTNVSVIETFNTLSNAEIVIFPNPSQDKISIKFNQDEKPVQIKIYSASGDLVYDNRFFLNRMEIDVSNFSSGLYIMFLENDNLKASSKLLIE